ncbi:MAG TPA: hypothetical protein VGS41_05040 [Chthonomonadales bacterium]|nr:hypothetical protein [Chthonomonadales bacterium]
MKRTTFILTAIIVAALLICRTGSAMADTPVADPGFAFVDVNGDGLYSASDGDIGIASTPSVDINALIQGGYFNTSVSQGAYTAPCGPASLVIPASQQFTLTTCLELGASQDVIVHGQLTAPTIELSGCRTVDLTSSSITFGSCMETDAGCDLIVDGAAIAGDPACSAFYGSAWNAIYGRPVNSSNAAIFTANEVELCSNCGVTLTGASISTGNPNAEIEIESYGDVDATESTAIASGGTVEIASCYGNAQVLAGGVFGTCIDIYGACAADFTDSAVAGSGQVTIEGDTVTGNSALTAVSSASLGIDGAENVDVSTSSLQAAAGPLCITCCNGSISDNSATLQSSGGLTVHAAESVSGLSAIVNSDRCINVAADCGCAALDQSVITPYSATSGVRIAIQAAGNVTAPGAQWSIPGPVNVISYWEDILAQYASISTGSATTPLSLTAYGGLINITGAVLVGKTHYCPRHVTVVGP